MARDPRALLRYKQTAPIGIGETRREQHERLTLIERAVIAAVHDWVWAHRPVCQVCGGRRRAECIGRPDEMHEDPSRAETRGRPAWERFNIRVCGRLCHMCHQDVTHHRMRLEFADPARRFLGPVRGVRRLAGGTGGRGADVGAVRQARRS